jgi:hypothetical protein
LNAKCLVRDVAQLEYVLVFMKFERSLFPAPTLARKNLGSDIFLADLPKGVARGSTNFTYQFFT